MTPTIQEAIQSLMDGTRELEERAIYHHEQGENKKAYEIQVEVSKILESIINLKSI